MILVKFSKNFDLFRKFGNISIKWNIRKISILVKYLKKFRFWSNFRIISILDKIYENFENFDFGQNLWKFRKILILVKFSKNFAFGHKFRFPSKIWKNFELVKFSRNMDFGQILEKIWILVKILENFEKFRF